MKNIFPAIASRCFSPFWLAFALAGGAALPLVVEGAVVQDSSTGARSAQSNDVYRGKTLPSKEIELSFDNNGKVAEAMVEPGDLVEEGQELMRQDDRPEQSRLEELRIEADVDARVLLAVQRYDLATVQLKRQEELALKGAAKQLELEEARLNQLTAETQISEERRQGLAAGARVAQLEIMLEQKLLKSPATGIVQIVDSQVGEISGPQRPALKIVTIDPLEIETLEMDTAVADQLKAGDMLQVRYMGEDEWREATVKFIDPVGNYAVGQQTVRLTLPNPDGHAAGRQVEIRLPVAE